MNDIGHEKPGVVARYDRLVSGALVEDVAAR
jgi:hypothetical protein